MHSWSSRVAEGACVSSKAAMLIALMTIIAKVTSWLVFQLVLQFSKTLNQRQTSWSQLLCWFWNDGLMALLLFRLSLQLVCQFSKSNESETNLFDLVCLNSCVGFEFMVWWCCFDFLFFNLFSVFRKKQWIWDKLVCLVSPRWDKPVRQTSLSQLLCWF